jgi:hypothetical protein
MPKVRPAKDIALAPIGVFKTAVQKVFSNNKKQSDQQMAAFQASNARKREAKKHR